MDTSLYGHLEPVGLNALEMMRSVVHYTEAKQRGLAERNWNPDAYWAKLLSEPMQTPNARWSQNYYFDGVIYEREPSDSQEGFIGSINFGSSGMDLTEAKRDLTDKWRSFVHYYGQTPTWDYWRRQGTVQVCATPPPPTPVTRNKGRRVRTFARVF
jgi:hypothetical protein